MPETQCLLPAEVSPRPPPPLQDAPVPATRVTHSTQKENQCPGTAAQGSKSHQVTKHAQRLQSEALSSTGSRRMTGQHASLIQPVQQPTAAQATTADTPQPDGQQALHDCQLSGGSIAGTPQPDEQQALPHHCVVIPDTPGPNQQQALPGCLSAADITSHMFQPHRQQSLPDHGSAAMNGTVVEIARVGTAAEREADVHAMSLQLAELELMPLKQLLKLCGQSVSVVCSICQSCPLVSSLAGTAANSLHLQPVSDDECCLGSYIGHRTHLFMAVP